MRQLPIYRTLFDCIDTASFFPRLEKEGREILIDVFSVTNNSFMLYTTSALYGQVNGV
jgi:hypothetical protein